VRQPWRVARMRQIAQSPLNHYTIRDMDCNAMVGSGLCMAKGPRFVVVFLRKDIESGPNPR
jgi:hypothetical protein